MFTGFAMRVLTPLKRRHVRRRRVRLTPRKTVASTGMNERSVFSVLTMHVAFTSYGLAPVFARYPHSVSVV